MKLKGIIQSEAFEALIFRVWADKAIDILINTNALRIVSSMRLPERGCSWIIANNRTLCNIHNILKKIINSFIDSLCVFSEVHYIYCNICYHKYISNR